MTDRGLTHRAVGGAEHDVGQTLIHGYCALCATPWPCEAELELQRARLDAIRAPAVGTPGGDR